MTENITFKLFHKDEIRRVTIPRPSFPRFLEFLHELFGSLQPEVRVTYLDSEGDTVTVNSEIEWNCALDEFKGQKITKLKIESSVAGHKRAVEQISYRFYYGSSSSSTSSKDQVPQAKLQLLAGSVPSLLEKYFEGKQVLPENIPEWLTPAMTVKEVSPPNFDLDINVPMLFYIIHQKAIDLLNSKTTANYLKAKFFLLDCLMMFPEHSIALYNLACAESLMGHNTDALYYLKKAVQSGYKKWQRMELDTDFDNIRSDPEYQNLISSLKKETETETQTQTQASTQTQEDATKKTFELEAKRRAQELIKFAEQRRQLLEAEAKALAEEQVKKELELAQSKREEEAQKGDEQVAALQKKWSQVIPLITAMGIEMTPGNMETLDRVQGDVQAFFDAMYQ